MWIKVKNIEVNERNSFTKIRNTNKNQSTISKTNTVVKTIIHGQEPHYLFNVKIKGIKRNLPKKTYFAEKNI